MTTRPLNRQPPPPAPGAPPLVRPEVMTDSERSKVRAAAFHATRVYPGPVGELVQRELLAWEDFGYRIGGGRHVDQLVRYVMAQKVAR